MNDLHAMKAAAETNGTYFRFFLVSFTFPVILYIQVT